MARMLKILKKILPKNMIRLQQDFHHVIGKKMITKNNVRQL